MFSFKFSRQLLLAAVLVTIYFPTRAQEFYVRASAANNFGIGGMTAYKLGGQVNEFDQQITYEQVKLNLGSGLVLNAHAGVFFSQHFGVEVGLGYLKGKTHTIESRLLHTRFQITESIDEKVTAPMLLFQGSAVVRGAAKTITPYARIGAVWAKGDIRQKEDHKLWNQKLATESKYTGSGFGFQGGIGLDFKANQEITFFAEATISNLTYTPEKWELTKATYNEETILFSEFDKNEREKVFVDSYSVYYNEKGEPVVNPNAPGEEPRKYIPFNSIGLGIGLKYTL